VLDCLCFFSIKKEEKRIVLFEAANKKNIKRRVKRKRRNQEAKIRKEKINI